MRQYEAKGINEPSMVRPSKELEFSREVAERLISDYPPEVRVFVLSSIKEFVLEQMHSQVIELEERFSSVGKQIEILRDAMGQISQ